jgi:hypothetical protein
MTSPAQRAEHAGARVQYQRDPDPIPRAPTTAPSAACRPTVSSGCFQTGRELLANEGRGELSTMSSLDTEFADPPTMVERVAMVRRQLTAIPSRTALLDSYRRESLYRLAYPGQASGSAAEALDMAYALRWIELDPELAKSPPDPLQS